MRPDRFLSLLITYMALTFSVVTMVCADDLTSGYAHYSSPPAEDNLPPAPGEFLRQAPPLPVEPLLPAADDDIYLPPLEEELQRHGGSYLYEPSDVFNARHAPYADSHGAPLLRLPEDWEEPQPPIALPNKFLGPGAIKWNPDWHWCGDDPTMLEPRFVLHGSYELFGTLFEQDRTRLNGIGHQLLVDLDYRLTGTERLHVQFRPFGEDNSGGSFWQLNEPTQYIDNSVGAPQRWWFEGELQSLFGPWRGDETHQLDINFTVGRFPFRLHNGLLMNDEIVGVALAKNNILLHDFSNLNVQLFYALDDVDSFPAGADLWGVNLQADYRNTFFEGTYAYLNRGSEPRFQSHYLAGSATKFFGPLTLAGRTMYKFDDSFQAGDGNLQVVESNFTRVPSDRVTMLTGIEETVSYMNLFYASENWTTIAGGGFDRLRNAFAVNPLLNIAAGAPPAERYGVSLGTRLFRHRQDEAWIPEFAYERQSSEDVFGVGLRYQRKVCPRTFFEVRGIKNWSNEEAFERDGLFSSMTVVF